MGDQPVGIAQLALADVIGRARADRLPVVVPGVQVFEELAQRAVAVFAAAAVPRASRPGGSRAAAGCLPPCDRASPPCCTGRAGSGRAGRRRRPASSGRIVASQFQAASLVWSPRSRFRPISSAKTTARSGAAATVPAQAGGRGVGQQGRAGLDRTP